MTCANCGKEVTEIRFGYKHYVFCCLECMYDFVENGKEKTK